MAPRCSDWATSARWRQTGDGRQGRAVPEIRRYRRVRHRNRRARPGQAGRHHRRAGADLRRHQPGGHQGAGMLHRRAQAARAHEDPGIPRRPARHRDHRRRGRAQRTGSGGQEDRRSEDRHHRRRRGRHRLPGHAGGAGREAREHPRPTTARACSTPAATNMDPDKQRYARDTDKRTLAEIVEGADVFLGLSAGGMLKPEMVATMAERADHPGAGQSEAGNPAGGRQGACARTASSPPAARTIRTRSTTRCASRTSSAARWMSAPPASTRR